MALTVLFALLGSLVISLTLMPVLAATVLSREKEHEPLIMRIFHRLYQPLARLAVYHPVVISLVDVIMIGEGRGAVIASPRVHTQRAIGR